MITADELHRILHYDPETGHFTRLTKASWNAMSGHISANGYVQIRVGNRLHYAHRLAWLYMNGQPPPKYLDHRNGNPTDNRWSNLRAATQTQNNANAKRRRDNTSGLKGVFWDRRRWAAFIAIGGKRYSLGRFKSKEEAHAAYLAAAREHFGEFARAQ